MRLVKLFLTHPCWKNCQNTQEFYMSPMFIPGPVDVNPKILEAQAQPMLPHRSPEFERIFKRASQKAQTLFYTSARVFLFASSGTGLQEAAVRNLSRGRLLSLSNGAFGERWHQVALSNGVQADKLEADWGKPFSLEKIAEAAGSQKYDALTVVHNETSTGMENPVKEIADVVHSASPDTLICVDAVSSLGGVKIETDSWGLDVVLTSSQKCLALPPGLGLCAVSDRAMERAKSVPNRGWYFDFIRMEKHRNKDSTPATPAVSLIYALDAQLDRILGEGLEKRFERHAACGNLVRSWALKAGFGLFAEQGYRSNTVTTVDNRLSLDISDLNRYLRKKNMRIANGYGPLKGETLRIAHMGEIQLDDIQRLLEALDQYIQTV
jgi:predicted phosphoserine aminotransferase